MKQLILIVLLVLLTTAAQAKIYRWVDANGTIHFSDRAYTSEAKEVKIRGSNLTVNNPTEIVTPQDNQPNNTFKPTGSKQKAKEQKKEKVITEADYKVSPSVGKLGNDIISISGRISSGPRCKSMTVTATARNENGLSATITNLTSKSNSYGSTTFEGITKVAGSGEDRGSWDVESVTVRCND